MSDITELQTDARLCPVCPDEMDCETLVEPEIDGDHRYYECQVCGYAFGWSRVSDGVKVEGSCAIGVPESVRKTASLPAMRAEQIIAGRTSAAVPLGMPMFRK
jgi:hypothetical protein